MIDIKAIREFDASHKGDARYPSPTVIALCDEIERLRKDAERYQWLRDPDTDLDELAATYYPGKEVPSGEEFDAAIDAAMEAKTCKN